MRNAGCLQPPLVSFSASRSSHVFLSPVSFVAWFRLRDGKLAFSFLFSSLADLRSFLSNFNAFFFLLLFSHLKAQKATTYCRVRGCSFIFRPHRPPKALDFCRLYLTFCGLNKFSAHINCKVLHYAPLPLKTRLLCFYGDWKKWNFISVLKRNVSERNPRKKKTQCSKTHHVCRKWHKKPSKLLLELLDWVGLISL